MDFFLSLPRRSLYTLCSWVQSAAIKRQTAISLFPFAEERRKKKIDDCTHDVQHPFPPGTASILSLSLPAPKAIEEKDAHFRFGHAIHISLFTVHQRKIERRFGPHISIRRPTFVHTTKLSPKTLMIPSYIQTRPVRKKETFSLSRTHRNTHTHFVLDQYPPPPPSRAPTKRKTT